MLYDIKRWKSINYICNLDSWSTTDNAINNQNKSFKFCTNDTISCTFDPKDYTITFKKAIVKTMWKTYPSE